MKLRIHNVFTKLVDVTPKDRELVEMVKQFCTIEFCYKGRDVNTGHMVERVIPRSFYSAETRTIPSGWVPRVIRRFDIEYIDKRERPEPLALEPYESEYKLRPYQVEAVERCVKRGRGIVTHPTGAGKTVVIEEVIARLRVPTMVIVPKLDLLYQTRDRFAKRFPDVGVLGEGEFRPGLWVTVATPQTLWRRYDDEETQRVLLGMRCLVVDEAHHIRERDVALGFRWTTAVNGEKRLERKKAFDVNTWWKLACSCKNAYYRFGFTATPGEAEAAPRWLLESMTGTVIHKRTSQELIELGYLSRPKILLYECWSEPQHNWRASVNVNIVHNEPRNELIRKLVERELGRNRRVLVIVDRVEHGKILWKTIEDAEFIYGRVPGEVRKKVLEALRTTGCVIGTVFDEGSDVPELDTVLIAGGGRSARRLIQRIGRVLRPAKGKTAKVIDIYDRDEEGVFTTNYVGMLHRQAIARRRVYEKQGYEVLLKKPLRGQRDLFK